MATEIRVPTLGESVSEATVGTWFKKVGDVIKADEPLCELETDKVTIEVPAPAAGVLSEIVANAGDTVAPGGLLGQISAGASAGASAPAAAEKAVAAAPAAEAKPAAAASSMPPAPSAAKLLAENNVSADQVDGSGKRGQVLKGDVIAAVAKGITATPAAAAEPVKVVARVASTEADAPREERVKMTRLRQTIAKRLKDAQNTAAMLTTYNEVDMSAVMDLRNRYKDLFEKKHGVKLGFMGFFTKAVTHALKELPAVNAE
ncbi:MAG: biotin/lipoyl-containing protein, partial [Shinella sp.]